MTSTILILTIVIFFFLKIIIQSNDWHASDLFWYVGCVVAVRTWRVTMLFHPTAAFLLKLGQQLCGAVHDGSDAAVWLTASH